MRRYSKAAEAALASERATPPDVLYHFTDAGGMLNIVSARKLWATIVTGLNDLSELTYGLQVVLARRRALGGPYREDIASHLSLEAMALPDRGRFLPFTTSSANRKALRVNGYTTAATAPDARWPST